VTARAFGFKEQSRSAGEGRKPQVENGGILTHPSTFLSRGYVSGLEVRNGIYSSTTNVSSPSVVRIDRAFKVINQMVTDGVIQSYAIGGATAAFFYIEPDTTYDVDIFCVLSGVKPNALDMLTPIYDYLKNKKYQPENEAINIEGVAVQFLPVFNPLNEEAVEHAKDFDYEGIPVRVMSPEHLVAIMLQTGRPKDFVRVARFLDADAFDLDSLNKTLKRHNLDKEWAALVRLQRRLGK